MHISCKSFFLSHLGKHWPAQHTLELVATNDCLASFKYEYEFVTNYDFDEFILPRRHLPTRDLNYTKNLTCKSFITDSHKIQANNTNTQAKFEKIISLYEFVTDLIKELKSANSSRKIAALHFKHMLMFDNIPNEFLVDLFNTSLLNTSRRVLFDYNKMRFYFYIDPPYDAVPRSWFNETRQLAECLTNFTQTNTNGLSNKWNRVYGIWLDVRRGKSIYNTDYVDLINQHEVQHLNDPSAEVIDLPLDKGFVSHFREPIDGQFFLGQIYSFNNYFRADFEYSLFAAQMFSFKKIV